MEDMQTFMNTVSYALSPIARFGERKYSLWVPLCTVIVISVLIEYIANVVLRDPNSIGISAIFVYVVLILYFSFRDGIIGGFTATTVTLAYYLYIIVTRRFTGERLATSLETVVALGVVYYFFAAIIGWLRQTIDTLLERESNDKRRLQTIVQQLPVGVIVTNANGSVELANAQAEEIIGSEIPLGFMMGKTPLVKASKHGHEVRADESLITLTLRSGRPMIDQEYTIHRPDGKDRHILASASPITNTRGKIVAAAVIMNDITTQKEVEIRKDDFVNMASHELKTPITSLQLYLALLQKATPDSAFPQKKLIDKMHRQMGRLQKIVNDLLDVSRIQTGKLRFSMSPLRLDSFLEETVAEMQQADSHPIEIIETGNILVHADSFRLYQVITNLLTNAMKCSKPATPIHIRLRTDGAHAIISVQDFGVGIKHADQEKIFERLYQVQEDHGALFPGFGMGLYIAREIVKQHKGNMWVQSEPGKGATFFIRLPRLGA